MEEIDLVPISLSSWYIKGCMHALLTNTEVYDELVIWVYQMRGLKKSKEMVFLRSLFVNCVMTN